MWQGMKRVLPQFREMLKDQKFLANLETAAKRFEEWSKQRSPGHIEAISEFTEQPREKGAAAATS